MTHAFISQQEVAEMNGGHNYCPFIPVFGAPSVIFERGQ